MTQFECPAFVRNGQPDHERPKHLLGLRRVLVNGKMPTLWVDDNVRKRGREGTVGGQLSLHDVEDARRARVESIHDDLVTPANAQGMTHSWIRAGTSVVPEWGWFREFQQRADE